MACRGLYIFSHATGVGNAPAHALFERIEVQCQDGVEVPRKFLDYEVTVNEQGLPEGVTLTRLVG
jgi:CRISPR-associated protein Csd2